MGFCVTADESHRISPENEAESPENNGSDRNLGEIANEAQHGYNKRHCNKIRNADRCLAGRTARIEINHNSRIESRY